MYYMINNVILHVLELKGNYLNNVIFGIVSFIVIIILIICAVISRKYKIVYNAQKLRKYIKANNVMNSIKIIEKYPEAINVQFKSDGYTPFLEACKKGNAFLVNIMLKQGANLNIRTNRGESAFYVACFNIIETRETNDASLIHALYHAGANIDTKTNFGYTPLHLASAFGHVSLADWLISKNANYNINPLPYVLASYFGHKKVSRLLRQLIEQKQLNK